MTEHHPTKFAAFLAAMLGSERAADATIVISKAAPPAMVAYQLLGFSLNEWSLLLGIFFTCCLILGQIYKLARWGGHVFRHWRANYTLAQNLKITPPSRIILPDENGVLPKARGSDS